jgi:hypothetical protein
MRMMLNVRIPNEPFNSLARQGKAGEILGRIVEALQPEAVYFTEVGGLRGVVAIVDLADPSKIPSLAEPWFLSFNAECELRIVMSPADLQNAGLGELGERWG